MNNLGRFFSANEKEYYAERTEVLKNVPSEDVANAPFLFTARQGVTDALARYELFKLVLGVSGHIVECGVNRGNSLMLFAHLSSILEPFGINRRIVGFDTFEGFRSIDATNDPADISEVDFFHSETFSRLGSAVRLYDLNRPAGHMNRVDIVKGDATETIPQYASLHPEMTIALLYLDFDIYEPTRRALEVLYPLVCKGGIVVFDQFNYEKFAGETAAAKSILDIGSVSLQRFPFAPFIAYFRKGDS